MEEKDKPLTDPSEQDVSSEEGKDVKATSSPEDKELEKEIEEAAKKLIGEDPADPVDDTKAADDSKDDKDDKGTTDNDDTKTDDVQLTALNKLSGRNFKSVDEFEKHYKNLSTFVGTNPEELKKKADEYDKLMSDASKAADEVKADKTKNVQKKADPVLDASISRLDAIEKELQKEKFLKLYPETESMYDIIVLQAEKTGKTTGEIYSGSELESLLTSKKEFDEAKANDKGVGVHSKGRLAPTKGDKLTGLVSELKNTQRGGKRRDVDEIKQRLVEEALDMNLKDQTI